MEQELDMIVSIYDKFKDYGIESFEGFDGNEFLKTVLNDENQTNVLFDIVQKVLDLQLVDKLAIPAVFGYAKQMSNLRLYLRILVKLTILWH